jgi:hypothetical protein
MIIREPPNRVEWAKASIRKKKLFFQCKCALGSNLELGDNKREPPNRVEKAKASIEKKNFKFKSGRVSNLELVDNKRAPEPRRLG